MSAGGVAAAVVRGDFPALLLGRESLGGTEWAMELALAPWLALGEALDEDEAALVVVGLAEVGGVEGYDGDDGSDRHDAEDAEDGRVSLGLGTCLAAVARRLWTGDGPRCAGGHQLGK